MQQEKLKQQVKPDNYSFTVIPDFFFRKLIKGMGVIPSLIYLTLLSYCHKKSYMAWPSLNTMSQEMGIAKTTIIRNLNILIKLNLIQNITRDTSCKNYYQHNVYQLLPPKEILLSLSSDQEKNTTGGSVALPQRVENTSISGSVTIPPGFQNATSDGSGTIPQVVAERYPNNNNLNNNNITTTKRENVAVNFKKLKEEGEEKMQAPYNSKEHYTGQAIRERMAELDFKEGFVEKMLKEYSLNKIEEKLDLLMERKNIKSPAGWLNAALKNDYRGEEPVEESEDLKCRGLIHQTRQESAGRMNPPPTKTKTNSENDKILSTEEARRRFHSLRE